MLYWCWMSQQQQFRPLPAGFSTIFHQERLVRDPSTVVAIDPQGTILWTNPAWEAFAADNGGSEIATSYGVGQRYYAGISGELRGFFEQSFQRSYVEGTVFELEYECSSAQTRRVMRLRALPIRGSGLLLEHSRVTEGPIMLEGLPAIEARYLDQDGVIRQCSDCRRVLCVTENVWDWVPVWVERPDPRISHGLCDVCVGFYWHGRRRKLG
jgi:hypothetical protein